MIKLEALGGPEDKRIKKVRITGKGAERCPEAEQHMEKEEANMETTMENKQAMEIFNNAPVAKAVLKNAVPAMTAMLMVLIYTGGLL